MMSLKVLLLALTIYQCYAFLPDIQLLGPIPGVSSFKFKYIGGGGNMGGDYKAKGSGALLVGQRAGITVMSAKDKRSFGMSKHQHAYETEYYIIGTPTRIEYLMVSDTYNCQVTHNVHENLKCENWRNGRGWVSRKCKYDDEMGIEFTTNYTIKNKAFTRAVYDGGMGSWDYTFTKVPTRKPITLDDFVSPASCKNKTILA